MTRLRHLLRPAKRAPPSSLLTIPPPCAPRRHRNHRLLNSASSAASARLAAIHGARLEVNATVAPTSVRRASITQPIDLTASFQGLQETAVPSSSRTSSPEIFPNKNDELIERLRARTAKLVSPGNIALSTTFRSLHDVDAAPASAGIRVARIESPSPVASKNAELIEKLRARTAQVSSEIRDDPTRSCRSIKSLETPNSTGAHDGERDYSTTSKHEELIDKLRARSITESLESKNDDCHLEERAVAGHARRPLTESPSLFASNNAKLVEKLRARSTQALSPKLPADNSSGNDDAFLSSPSVSLTLVQPKCKEEDGAKAVSTSDSTPDADDYSTVPTTSTPMSDAQLAYFKGFFGASAANNDAFDDESSDADSGPKKAVHEPDMGELKDYLRFLQEHLLVEDDVERDEGSGNEDPGGHFPPEDYVTLSQPSSASRSPVSEAESAEDLSGDPLPLAPKSDWLAFETTAEQAHVGDGAITLASPILLHRPVVRRLGRAAPERKAFELADDDKDKDKDAPVRLSCPVKVPQGDV